MARDHARVFTRIWADREWRKLSGADQRAYLLVLSDPGLTHCGVAPIVVKRWAQQATDTTERSVRKALMALAVARYLVLDWDTEEVLARSLMRNDKVFQLPNVAKAAYSAWRSVHSPLLRTHILYEVHRIHEGPAADRTDKSFDPDYVGAWLHEPFPEEFTEGFPEGFAEGFPEPWPKGFSRAYDACVRRAHSPSPSPSPSPPSATSAPEGFRSVVQASKTREAS